MGLEDHFVDLALHVQDIMFGSRERKVPAAETSFHRLKVITVASIDRAVDCENFAE